MSPSIRPLQRGSTAEVDLVARRMRATLCEVLGEERGTALYTLDWLRERVRFHLDPARDAEVFLAEGDEAVVGHTIVRREEDGEGGELGLVSTIYVAPEARRGGVANALLDAAEAWFRARRLTRAATYTDPENAKLIALFERRGYALSRASEVMVRLAREL